MITAAYTLGDGITATALATNQEWPRVTIDNFEIKAAHARLDADSELIMFSPLVPGNAVEVWEGYASGKQDWLKESQELSYQTSAWFSDPINSEGLNLTGDIPPIPEKIFRLEGDERVTGYSSFLKAPVWQVSPAPYKPSLVNYDLLSNPTFERMFNMIVETAGSSLGLSEFLDISFSSFLYEGVLTDSAHVASHQRAQGIEDELEFGALEQPHTVLVSPVRGNFGPEPSMVGLISTVLSSDKFLAGQLPDGVNGVYVVIKNSCGVSPPMSVI